MIFSERVKNRCQVHQTINRFVSLVDRMETQVLGELRRGSNFMLMNNILLFTSHHLNLI